MKTFTFFRNFYIRPANSVTGSIHLCRLFLSLAIAALVFPGCSKKDEGGGPGTNADYYFRATLDGKKKEFYSVKFQGSGNDGRWEHLVIGGFEAPLSNGGATAPPSLDFEIWRLGGNIAAGAYSTPAEENMIARYAVQTADGTLLYNTSFADDIFTVKIETISKDGIKGTFSGTVRSQAGKAISVTEGSFNLPYDTLVNP